MLIKKDFFILFKQTNQSFLTKLKASCT